jgi:hypothetical protein
LDKINGLLELYFYGFCRIAKWIFAFRIASDIIKNGSNNDWQGTVRSLLNGSISYAALYSIVTVLDSVQNSFK